MPKFKNRKVGVITGSTGGHFFPGLAVGEDLRERYGAAVKFFVPGREYIFKWLEKKGFEYSVIPPCRITASDILSPFRFLCVFLKACAVLLHGRYGVVFITGSYATVPFLLAAKLCGIKTVVHEQNVRMGKVTRLSTLIADRITVTFPSLSGYPAGRTEVTGFPLIRDFSSGPTRAGALKELGFSPDILTVLVFGGSQGSDFLNRLVCDNFSFFREQSLQFIHLTGSSPGEIQALYDKNGIPAKVFRFYVEMSRLYSAADCVICRGGAGTLAEINAWKIPAIVVPYPHAGAHQECNALFFSERGCSMTVAQNDSSLRNFSVIFGDFLMSRKKMAEKMSKVSIVDKEGKTAFVVSRYISK